LHRHRKELLSTDPQVSNTGLDDCARATGARVIDA
jgi:hypothetical protein